MSPTEPDYEVFEFAIQREKQAYSLYMAMANRSENPVSQKLFEDLAAEELELEIMKLGITVDTTNPLPPEVTDSAETEDSVLAMDYQKVIELCIGKEDSAFRLYASMLSNMQSQDTRETIMQLMQQETKHKLRFETELESLLKYLQE